MNESIFRKKSLDRVSSPEQLNDYIRVSTPSVWIVLAAIVVLLCGVVIWGIFGRVDTTIDTVVVSDGGSVYCYIPSDKISDVESGTEVEVDGNKGKIVSISDAAALVDDSSYIESGYYLEAEIEGLTLSDGSYSADIITDSINPISFVIN